MVRKCKALLVILGVLLPGVASALGLGELRLSSFLNEPFRAEVDLLDVGGLDEGQLRIRLASRADFDRAGVERAYFLTSLKFQVNVREDGTGVLVITSEDAVLEPYLDFLVEARWPQGRLLREYTVLLDLPVLLGPDSGMTAGAAVPEPAPIVTDLDGDGSLDAGGDRVADGRYGSDADPAPGPGAKYLVKQDETLWSIAKRSRPEGSTVHQTMLDIQRLNPEAFIGDNINQMKAGYVLRLPTTSEISSSDLEEAVAEIAQQEQNWRDNQQAIDAREIEPETTDGFGRGLDDEEKGRLQIAGVEESEVGSGAISGGSASLEQLDIAQRDNDELRNRITSMEDQMLTLQRLLTLKDDQIAALQSALDGEEIETPAAIDEMEGTISEMPDPQASISEPEEAPPVVSRPPVDFSEPVPEPGIVGMLMDYLIYIVGLLVLIVLLVLWRFKDKLSLGRLPRIGRKGAQPAAAGDADDEFAGVELGDDGLIIDEFSDQGEDDSLATERLNFSDTDENAYAAQFETGDALAEADIYIAYGRFPQAVDLLKAAIAVEPANVEYRVKLMEACIEMVDREEFQQQYADLQLIGDEAALRRGRELLEAADGGEVWLDDLPEPSITQDDIEEARARTAGELGDDVDLPLEDDGLDEDVLSLDDDLGLDAGESDEVSLDDELSLDEDLDVAEDLDLDADLDTDLDLESADETGTDLDLGLELDSDEDLLELDDGLDDNDDKAASLEEVELEDDSLDLSSFADEPEEDSGETLAAVDEEDDSDLEHFDMSDFQEASEELVAEDSSADDESAASVDLPDLELDEITQGETEELPQEEEIELDDIVADTADASDTLEEFTAEPEVEVEPESDFESEETQPVTDAVAEVAEVDEALDLSDFADDSIDADTTEVSEPTDELDYLTEPPAELADAGDELITDFGDLEIEEGAGIVLEEPELGESEDLSEFDAEQVDLEQSLDELTSGFEEDEADQQTDDSGLVFAADSDEVSTKLDLARAYMDMGDEDGARSILEEVLQDGSEAQQQEAQSLIDKID